MKKDDISFKRLSRTNVFKIKYHFIDDGISELFISTPGYGLCDAINQLMDSVHWRPFVVDYIYEDGIEVK